MNRIHIFIQCVYRFHISLSYVCSGRTVCLCAVRLFYCYLYLMSEPKQILNVSNRMWYVSQCENRDANEKGLWFRIGDHILLFTIRLYNLFFIFLQYLFNKCMIEKVIKNRLKIVHRCVGSSWVNTVCRLNKLEYGHAFNW